MYKILLATDREQIRSLFHRQTWPFLGFSEPLYAGDSAKAISLLNSKAIDAIGFYFDAPMADELTKFLHYERPSLPVFMVCEDEEKQRTVLREMASVLNKMHSDMADAPYDDEMMRNMLRDELMHRLLSGEVEDFSVAERQLKLIRSHLSMTRPCKVYELDMPQGEVYVSEHTNAMERLERALRNNFFGRYVDRIYYAVAVLTPRYIRVAALPQAGIDQEQHDFEARADSHVSESLGMIKEYLNLDIDIRGQGMIPTLRSFTESAQN